MAIQSNSASRLQATGGTQYRSHRQARAAGRHKSTREPAEARSQKGLNGRLANRSNLCPSGFLPKFEYSVLSVFLHGRFRMVQKRLDLWD